MSYLSYSFKNKWIKPVIVIELILSNLILLSIIIFAIFNLNQIITRNITAGIILSVFFISNLIFNILFIQTKSVQIDNKLLIYYDKGLTIKVPVEYILKIKRIFYYFYIIKFRENPFRVKPLIFFISPNPKFSRYPCVVDIDKDIMKATPNF
jgi:hypothetical protein